MSIQTSSFNPLLTQQSAFNPTINTFDSGNVFDGRGNDFLSPRTVLTNVDSFSHTVSFGGDYLGSNPNARTILGNTTSSVNNILTGNFGINLAAPIAPVPNFAGAGMPVTTLPGNVTTNAVVVQQAVQTPSPALIRDLSNFNPLIWQNPNPSNILLGSMDAQNKIFGGPGLLQPSSFNQYPLYPFIAPPNAPYTGYMIPTIPSQGSVNTLQQAQMFPTTFATSSPFYNTTIQRTIIQPYFAGAFYNPLPQPFVIANSQTLMPYQQQVALASLLQMQSGAISSQCMRSLLPMNSQVSSSGMPPWIE